MLVVFVSDPLFQDFFITITIIIIIILLILSVARVCGPSEFHAISSVVYKFNFLLCLSCKIFLLCCFIHPYISIFGNFMFFKLAKFGELFLWGEVFLTYFTYIMGKLRGISNCV